MIKLMCRACGHISKWLRFPDEFVCPKCGDHLCRVVE